MKCIFVVLLFLIMDSCLIIQFSIIECRLVEVIVGIIEAVTATVAIVLLCTMRKVDESSAEHQLLDSTVDPCVWLFTMDRHLWEIEVVVKINKSSHSSNKQSIQFWCFFKNLICSIFKKSVSQHSKYKLYFRLIYDL